MGAVIWVVIVLVWGCVLIPMWLRRHDHTTGARSTSSEKLSSAMRVLSRREPGSRPRRWTVATRAERVVRTASTAASRTARTARAERTAASPAVRRRRRLVGLLALALITLIAAVFGGGIFLTAFLIVDVVLAGYVVHLRLAARRERELRRAQMQRERRARVAAAAYETALAEAELADVEAEQQRLAPSERRQVRVVDLMARAERERAEEEALTSRRAVGH
jgi:CRISPR/Cas system-associated endoribonuclease Cas2